MAANYFAINFIDISSEIGERFSLLMVDAGPKRIAPGGMCTLAGTAVLP
jgi:hypothetical protein